jgi:hypothetical protein
VLVKERNSTASAGQLIDFVNSLELEYTTEARFQSCVGMSSDSPGGVEEMVYQRPGKVILT